MGQGAGSIDIYVGSIPPLGPPTMPIISRGLPATAPGLNDGAYNTVEAVGGTAHAFAINLNSVAAASKSNVSLVWWNQATRPTPNPTGPWYGVPSAYTIDKNPSASGTLPTTGWVTLATVTGNTDAGRIHAGLDLSDAGWVRLNATGSNGNGLSLEIDLHDCRNGTDDAIVFAGDSNAMQAWNGQRLDGLAYNGGSLETLLEAATGRPAPIILNYGVGGEIASHYRTAYAPLVTALPCKYVHYNIGTNDCNNAGAVLSDAQLNTIRDSILATIADWQAAGKVVFWGTIPWGNAQTGHLTNVQALNAKMNAAVAADPSIRIGADAWAISSADTNLIGSDHLHFTYDPATQYTQPGTGYVGYEVLLREARDKLKANLYGM